MENMEDDDNYFSILESQEYIDVAYRQMYNKNMFNLRFADLKEAQDHFDEFLLKLFKLQSFV